MPNSPWNWDSSRQPDPSSADSPWNFDQRLQSFPWPDDNDNDNFNPWDDFDLTLAPINSENVRDNLPPLSPALLDAPAGLPPLPPSSLDEDSDDDLFVDQRRPSAHDLPEPRPPPSRYQAPISRERFSSPPLNSLDPFEEFSNLTPPPPNMAPSSHTRSSSFVDLTASSPVQARLNSPPSRKRKADTQGQGRSSKSGRTLLKADATVEDVECVNLEDVETHQEYEDMKARQQAEAIKAQNQADASKPIKLSEFKCIICMDDPTDLTVTHCGHLFCSECLFQALHAGDRKSCPVCRTPIVLPRPGQKPTSKGYFPLSLKLTTAKKHGKRAIRG